MSDDSVLDIPPGTTVATKQMPKLDGGTEEVFQVSFGAPPRVIEVVDLDLGQQFDLAEITGSTSAGNVQWHNMAFIAASVRSIDGVPVRGDVSKASLRETLTRLGVDGMKVAGLVIAGYRGGTTQPQAQTEEARRATVGN